MSAKIPREYYCLITHKRDGQKACTGLFKYTSTHRANTTPNVGDAIRQWRRIFGADGSIEVVKDSCMMVKQAQNALAFHSVGREIVQLQSEKFKRSLNQ